MAVFAKEVMTAPVVSVTADMSLKKFAEILDEYSFSGVPVIDAEEKVVGVITEADIYRYTRQIIGQPLRDPHRFLADNREVLHVNMSHGMEVIELVASTTVEMLMTREVCMVEENTPLLKVIRLMHECDINRVPVIDQSGRLKGIISRADIIGTLISRWQELGQD